MSDPHELVRVRDAAANVERTVKRLVAESDKDRYKILANKRAVDNRGLPLRVKPVKNLTQTTGSKPDGAAPSAANNTASKEN